MKKYIILLAAAAITFSACNDWLDISPQTEIKSSENFETEQGFKDALTGIYLVMNEKSLYGRELTFGMLDAMAQYYRQTLTGTSHRYWYDTYFEYTEDGPKAKHAEIWSEMYKAIANLNELISYIDEADQGMFMGRNYQLIRGEAYGLRAMLHFDLLRMFGPSYAAEPNTKCIPYVKTVSKNVTPLSTVAEVCNLALADLAIAMEELSADTVIDGNESTISDDETFERNRHYKFNYYAVKLLQARINLYTGNYPEAKKAALEVIGQDTFYWTPNSQITTSDVSTRNRLFSQELIFSLYSSDLSEDYTNFFTVTTGLYLSYENYYALFETEAETNENFRYDFRYYYLTGVVGYYRFSLKLEQPSNNQYIRRIPMMRISEAYYIAAECALAGDNDPAGAIAYLNTVRNQRYILQELALPMTTEEIHEEIRKEYAKEFINEGQLYYYYKRRNYDAIPVHSYSSWSGASVVYVQPDYVFPLPDDEIEYGGRE